MTKTEQQAYAEHRYLLIPRLMPPAMANVMAAAHPDDGNWRPYTGHDARDAATEAREFLHAMGGRVLQIVGAKGEYDLNCWVNRYRVGQYIFRHNDRARNEESPAVAILNVCLAAPSAENGGELVLALEDGEVRHHLRAGDALLFDGASIEHWTTPLVATTAEPEPLRMMAVGRYYLR